MLTNEYRNKKVAWEVALEPSEGAPASAMTTAGVPRVLVVDDEPVFRDAARRLLERRGDAVVAEAGCAASALDAVEHFAPHAVLLDVRLGDDDVFRRLRQLTRARPGLAVLLASTGGFEQCHALVASCGARGFIPKTRLIDTDLGQFWPRAGHQPAPDQPAITSARKRSRQEA